MSEDQIESMPMRGEEGIIITNNGHSDGMPPPPKNVFGQVEQSTPKSMKHIQVSIPTSRNNGAKVSAADWETILSRAMKDLGGFTVSPHGNGGCNCGCDIPCRDEIHKIEILVEDSPELLETILDFGRFIRQHLDQNKVLITFGDVDAVYIEDNGPSQHE